MQRCHCCFFSIWPWIFPHQHAMLYARSDSESIVCHRCCCRRRHQHQHHRLFSLFISCACARYAKRIRWIHMDVLMHIARNVCFNLLRWFYCSLACWWAMDNVSPNHSYVLLLSWNRIASESAYYPGGGGFQKPYIFVDKQKKKRTCVCVEESVRAVRGVG